MSEVARVEAFLASFAFSHIVLRSWACVDLLPVTVFFEDLNLAVLHTAAHLVGAAFSNWAH